MTAAAKILPAEFADLEPYAEWAIPTERARYDKRVASAMPEAQAFYDAAFPRMDEALTYLEQFSMDDLPDDAQHLLWLYCALVTVSFPVEVWRQPRVPDSGASTFDAVLEPAVWTCRVLRARRSACAPRASSTSTRASFVQPADLLVDGERIVDIAPTSVPDDTVTLDLGDLTLLPGLMDMEVNLLLGGPNHESPLNPVQDDPALRTLRAVANARRTLRAGFTTVRNLGLFVQTGGLLLDVALKKAIDFGWIDGPRVVPAGHAITPTGGHLDPTMFQALAPHIMPLTIEEGIANGVSEVRKAVRYQIKHGAEVIKVCASGGVMSHTGPAGAQQYSNEEPVAIADEAHRAGLKVAAHAHGDDGIRAAIEAGFDCIEHGSLMTDETMELFVERGTFLVATTYLADGMDVSRAAPELQAKAAEVFPQARKTISKAIERGVKVACGTDAPAIPHGRNAKELLALVDRGMTPLQAIRAATIVSADLIDKDDRGRIQTGLYADVIGVPGNPLDDIGLTEQVRFVMKGGQVYRND